MKIAKSLALLCLLLILAAAMGLASWVMVQAAGEPKTLDRNLEPAIIQGIQVNALIGAPVQHLFVYTFTGSGLAGRIPVQVDEVTPSGNYTGSEDNLLDANDEIIFMVKDLGNRATDTTLLTSTLPISPTWYEIEVTDPLSPTKKGWAYLVRSGTPSPPGKDYVDYITATQDISATTYKLGLATTYLGFDDLILNGSSTDILDRTKLRVTLPLFGTQTENNLVPATLLIKDGPIRVILQQTASAGGLAGLNNTYLAYGSLLQTTASVSSSFSLSKVRTSVDFSSAASGATFYNANVPAGVTINGSADSVPETPLSKWFQVSHSTGRLVQVTDLAQVGGTTQKNYYCEGAAECDGTAQTGDSTSYGDSGFLIEGNVSKKFSTKSILYLPTGSGPSNIGAAYETYFFNPLQICAAKQAEPCAEVFLPIILKGG
ncbi:MAG: hypothetical protein BroJett011_41180 [Chloroflexota bacterium]|nr:MAG: hypothetical protein BroJett011_41180 [Chloroflexota bacterium]